MLVPCWVLRCRGHLLWREGLPDGRALTAPGADSWAAGLALCGTTLGLI